MQEISKFNTYEYTGFVPNANFSSEWVDFPLISGRIDILRIVNLNSSTNKNNINNSWVCKRTLMAIIVAQIKKHRPIQTIRKYYQNNILYYIYIYIYKRMGTIFSEFLEEPQLWLIIIYRDIVDSSQITTRFYSTN